MTSREFCYWLQGYFELRSNKDCELTKEQAGEVQRHLSLVFAHDIDPSQGSTLHQQTLNAIHNSQSPAFSTSPNTGELRPRC